MNMVSKEQIEKDYDYCVGVAKSIDYKHYRDVALTALEEYKNLLLNSIGSDWQHHNYSGGLIVHIANVCRNSLGLYETYKESGELSLDLIKFGALMHDIGKCKDYGEGKTSKSRYLLGHGYEGTHIVESLFDRIKVKMDDDMKLQALHMVGCHMNGVGALEEQRMMEVVLIGFADHLDALMEPALNRMNSLGKGTLGGYSIEGLQGRMMFTSKQLKSE